ncbi:N-acetylglucosamine-6-phosphate deacetylase [Desertibacillus haloalkaliphilus]|uniref:N-acetylglucosamine-6-phosphate deacetylase n=1 Tax=Desertibacillus haloalkaliphilus TaxID=1328930 RepID=UPI001C264337|nr:N-acetylglucosamine-6-phosphate deacetylase [Desertibacillus haloalkaliphilus]MBU8906853.1 N-acetylglucosamine-6-phosphate deacetylase [Desertibacillus haloalkaliphilus]
MKENQNHFLIENVQIYAEEQTYKHGFVEVKDGKIESIGDVRKGINVNLRQVITLPNHYKVIPGMIDLHVHGAGGADTMDGSLEALDTIASVLPKEGVTSFLPTTMTQSTSLIHQALSMIATYRKKNQTFKCAEILGVHLEGPFLSSQRAGAQPIEYMIELNKDLFKDWQAASEGAIKVVTFAPELRCGGEFIDYLYQTGVIASIGHSDATFLQVTEAVDRGASQVTHLFNGMRGMHHREPGVVGSALLNDGLIVELIADGIHVHPEMLKLTFQQKGADKVILITDAMRAKGLGDGIYQFADQKVMVSDQQATLADQTLAGSILHMDEAVRNMMTFSGCRLEDVIKMTAVNPAKQINIYDRKGSIAPGKDADLVILNEKNEVEMTFCCGCLAYSRNNFQ